VEVGVADAEEGSSRGDEGLAIADVGSSLVNVGLTIAVEGLSGCPHRVRPGPRRARGGRAQDGRRWIQGWTRPDAGIVVELARIVQPIDAALALDLVRAHNALRHADQSTKFVLSEEPFLPKPAQAALDPNVVDAIVCAASDAADESPRVMRRALYAAFARAEANGAAPSALVKALAPPRRGGRAGARTRRRG
jgi:hypothetical protein